MSTGRSSTSTPIQSYTAGKLALYGRPIDTISEVFPLHIRGGDFKGDLIRKLWFLDFGLAALGRRYPLWQRHYLSAKLPKMYAEQPLQLWCTISDGKSSGNTSASAFLLDRETILMLKHTITDVIRPVRDRIRQEKTTTNALSLIMGDTSSTLSSVGDVLDRLSLKLDAIKAFILLTTTTRPEF